MQIPESLAVALHTEDMRIIRAFGTLGLRLLKQKKKKNARAARILKEIEERRICANEHICPID
jgi:hypothetical protein